MRDIWEAKRTLLVWRGGTVDLYMRTTHDPDTKYIVANYHRYTDTIPNFSNVKALDGYRYVVVPEIEGFRFNVLAGWVPIICLLRGKYGIKLVLHMWED